MEILQSEKESFRQYFGKRLSVQKEFMKLFNEVLFSAARDGKDLTHQQAFNLLNHLYFNLTGKLRFENYITFTIQRIRLDNKEMRETQIAKRLAKIDVS